MYIRGGRAREGRREREKESRVGGDKELSGVFAYKDTNPIRSGLHSDDLI